MYSLLTKDQFFTRVIHFLESRALNKKTIETTFQFGIFFSLTSFHHLRNLGFNISDSSSMTFSQTTTSLVGKESVSKIIILVVIITITHIFIFFSISIIFSFFSISIIVYLFLCLVPHLGHVPRPSFTEKYWHNRTWQFVFT